MPILQLIKLMAIDELSQHRRYIYEYVCVIHITFVLLCFKQFDNCFVVCDLLAAMVINEFPLIRSMESLRYLKRFQLSNLIKIKLSRDFNSAV